jgi:phage baseplate assembly protein W
MAQYSDLDLTFTAHPETGDLTRVFDENAIKGAMKNILLTDIGSKPFDRYFGMGLQSLLFEDLGPGKLVTIERLVYEKLSEYEPRIVVESVNMNLSDIDSNTITIVIEFYMVGDNTIQQLNFAIERTR